MKSVGLADFIIFSERAGYSIKACLVLNDPYVSVVMWAWFKPSGSGLFNLGFNPGLNPLSL